MSGFTHAAELADVPDGGVLAVEVEGLAPALVRCGDEVFAVRDECSHAAVPLSEGEVEDCTLECWLLGSRFDARTGEVLNLPATEPVPVYPCKVTEDSTVLVDVTSPSI